MKMKLNSRNKRKFSDLCQTNNDIETENKYLDDAIKNIADRDEIGHIITELKKTDDLVVNSIQDINDHEQQVDRQCHKKYGRSLKQMAELSPNQVRQVVYNARNNQESTTDDKS